MSEKIKMGIIGIGNMGSAHSKNIVGGEGVFSAENAPILSLLP